MPAAYFLLGEPDPVGMLIYAPILLASAGGFALVVFLIHFNVFRKGRAAHDDHQPAGGGGRR